MSAFIAASQPGAMSPADSWLFLGFLVYASALIGVRDPAGRRVVRHLWFACDIHVAGCRVQVCPRSRGSGPGIDLAKASAPPRSVEGARRGAQRKEA